jgi:hypothetical protein
MAQPVLAGTTISKSLRHDNITEQPLPNSGHGFETVALETHKVMVTGTSALNEGYEPKWIEVQQTEVITQAPSTSENAIVCCPDKGMQGAEFDALPEEIRKNARPGQCFARLLTTPKKELTEEKVLVAEERSESRTIAAEYAMVSEKVMTSPEKTVARTVPAKTRQISEKVIDQPESFRDEVIAAKYQTVTERVLVSAERDVWTVDDGIKTGAALITPQTHEPMPYRADGTLTWPGKNAATTRVSETTSEYLTVGSGQPVYCLKKVPAEYRDVQKKVEVSPARTVRHTIPATYKMVTRTVVDEPERIIHETVPAVYEMRSVRKEIKPARTETRIIPAIYKTEMRAHFTSEPQPVWREVLCERNTTPSTVSAIQKALKSRGYNVGVVDGVLGQQTVRAMQAFSADNGLPQGQISLEAVKLLGVSRH